MHTENGHGRSRLLINTLAAVGVGAVIVEGVRFGMELFGPARDIRLDAGPSLSAESTRYAEQLSCIVDALLYRDAAIQVLKNGAEFYPAEFDAVGSARDSINLEAYEFSEGEITREFIRILTERARAGVEVRLLIDAIGSWKAREALFRPLLDAGGRFVRFHPLNLKDWPYLDHRTHRKLLIVDGRVGFIGGAGFADHWIRNVDGKRPWRDTVLRVEGEVVSSLNAAFAQNWVGATGQILFGDKHFPKLARAGDKTCMVVMSTPGLGATRARVLFQALIEAAQSQIEITTPYFLPDHSARKALIRDARDRGVAVRILTAGPGSDHPSVRRLSEAVSARLIRAGVEFYEYQPGMIHAKLLTVDGMWTVAGSTNFDHRSFTLNDEVNMVICDEDVCQTIRRQFSQDLQESRQFTKRQMKNTSLESQAIADLSWAVRREE